MWTRWARYTVSAAAVCRGQRVSRGFVHADPAQMDMKDEAYQSTQNCNVPHEPGVSSSSMAGPHILCRPKHAILRTSAA